MSSTSARSKTDRPLRPCLSLPHAIRSLAMDAGGAIQMDALCASMSLSLMVPAVPEEPDFAAWPLYARDAFLIPAGRLFGLTIRAMHPPEAARGLPSSEEFRQHFDASYRPLVLRALEHDQPVLAWQGWPGKERLSWGIITDACDGGVGLKGRSFGCDAETQEQALERPPVQLYVVELIESRQPKPGELVDAFLAHAKNVLGNELHTRFGVTSGPAAYDRWIQRLRDAETGEPAVVRSHRSLAASVIAGHESAERFVKELRPDVNEENGGGLDKMSRLLSAIVESLTAAHGNDKGSLAPGVTANALTQARDETTELAAVLSAM